MKEENGISMPPEAQQLAEKIIKAASKLDSICPICRHPAQAEQVGRCVYLTPCGHQYQGRLSGKRGAR